MSPLTRRVAKTIRRHALIAAGDRVAVAVSGGPDSVALLWLLHEIQTELDFSLAGLIHVNHGLRGEEASRDEAFCRALAARLDVPIEVGQVDVARRVATARQSLEAAARDLRYAFLAEAATRLEATSVATGHTLDDQAETVLLRLLRGAGSRGLTGIRIRRGRYIRPLLECRRRELQDYLVAKGESSCADSSNENLSIPRNRVRHELIPLMERLAPAAVPALGRFARFSGEDEAYLTARATELAAAVVLINRRGQASLEGDISLDRTALAKLAGPMARRIVRMAAEQVCPSVALSARHLEAVRELAAADKQTANLDLPGLNVHLHAGILTIKRAEVDRARRGEAYLAPTQDRALPVPGVVSIPEAGLMIRASLESRAPHGSRARGRGDVATVQASAVRLPLAVRTWRAGDRMRPLGAPGRRKLQDVFVDRKVPREERDRVPLVVDADGRIVWVVGLTVAHDCRVTAPESGVVVLKVEQ